MPVPEKDIKLLWGRAAGLCSNPSCRQKLSDVGTNGESFLTGEMAHVIARNPGGPRGTSAGGEDTYDNLILLCPSCHRTVDKAPPGTFSVALLNDWKMQHEAWVEGWGSSESFTTAKDLASFIANRLMITKICFDEYGPKSQMAQENPGSNAHKYWIARKLDTILPANREISNAIQNNIHLFDRKSAEIATKFVLHARGFEQSQYERLENYPLFPEDFGEAILEISR